MKKKKYSQVDASIPTIRRLPSYLNVIRKALTEGVQVISGTVIATELDLEPIQVRKDLAVTGIVGKPRVGYNVQELITAIESFLNWDKKHRAVVVGTGHLGTALLGYLEFRSNGMDIIAAFDNDEDKIGQTISHTPVYAIDKLKECVQENDISMVILTVPSAYAQQITNSLIGTGISAIWNFTNVKLKVPDDILVLREDLSSSYAVLTVCK